MPWGQIGGAAIGAVGSLIGGAINNANANSQAALQYKYQKEFAQNGIRWKVADAKAAGIHPLAALGAQTFSYNPVAVSTGDGGISEALGRMGQGVSRAAEAKELEEVRQLNKALTQANIDKVKAETNFVNQQAAASAKAVTETALPPPMPIVNGKTATNPGEFSKILDKPIQAYGWLKDERGNISGIIPSEDAKNRTEDVLGVEWIPWMGAAVRNLRAKLLGEPIDGHYWHGADKGFKPYPPKKTKGFFDHAKDVFDFYAR